MSVSAVYLTAREVAGLSLRVESIDARLARLPLSQSLDILSQMTFSADAINKAVVEPTEQIALASRVFPRVLLPRIVKLLESSFPKRAALSSQLLILLTIRLLAVGNESVPETDDLDALGRRLGHLALALADHVNSGRSSEQGVVVVEMLRIVQLYKANETEAWASIAGQLFFDVLPSLKGHRDWIDVPACFEKQTGLPLDHYWSITAIAGYVANDGPVKWDAVDPQDTVLVNWLSLLSATVEEKRPLARLDCEDLAGWSMKSVWRKPIIELPTGQRIVAWRGLFRTQVEPSAMFAQVADQLTSAGIVFDTWSRLYGAAIELFGISALRKHCKHDRVLDENEFVGLLGIGPTEKRADALVLGHDGGAVVIDFVARRFTEQSMASGGIEHLRRDLRLGITEKLEQIDSTIKHALANGTVTSRVFPIVVTAGPLPPLWLIDRTVDEILQESNLSCIGSTPICNKWLAMDLLNFLAMLRAVEHVDRPLVSLVTEWQTSGAHRDTFLHWLTSQSPHRVPGDGMPHGWHSRAAEYCPAPPTR